MAPFGDDFAEALKMFVNIHHAAYPDLPPQGIYFEKLVERAFKNIKKPFTRIESGGANQPRYDLLVDDRRVSLKTETGIGTDPSRITITKLCTTEREPWTASELVRRAMEHLDRYDLIVMLRAIWDLPLIHYQLLEVRVSTLKRLRSAAIGPVGRRRGRTSLAGDVLDRGGGQRIFRVFFDASDGKCAIRDLLVSKCDLLLEWDFKVHD